LLPYWLKHHKKYFDHGIIIDYNSTDRSIEIVKEICPTWEIHTTKNEYFYAPDVEPEILEYEKNIDGWRVVLNTTEFLFGYYDKLNQINENSLILIGSHTMVDNVETEFKEINENIFKERCNGISMFKNPKIIHWRSFQNYLIDYPSITGPGRHWGTPTTTDTVGITFDFALENQSKDFFILWYGFSPFNEKLIKRKLQIQTKTHPNGQWTGGHVITEQELLTLYNSYQSQSEDLSEIINKFL
jgi:hypothetical protein